MDPLREFLVRMSITGFDARRYIDTHRNNATALPNIGIAASGGGYRALLNAGGALAAFDSRTPNSTNTGQLGGLLQSATYLAGLSGGGWLVGSLMVNNFTSVQDLMNGQPDDSGVWQLSQSILEGMFKETALVTCLTIRRTANFANSNTLNRSILWRTFEQRSIQRGRRLQLQHLSNRLLGTRTVLSVD